MHHFLLLYVGKWACSLAPKSSSSFTWRPSKTPLVKMRAPSFPSLSPMCWVLASDPAYIFLWCGHTVETCLPTRLCAGLGYYVLTCSLDRPPEDSECVKWVPQDLSTLLQSGLPNPRSQVYVFFPFHLVHTSVVVGLLSEIVWGPLGTDVWELLSQLKSVSVFILSGSLLGIVITL